jgi:glycosyltransferase involved in cell wall biosynthesis
MKPKKILIHSSTPECQAGYGNVIREVLRRLKSEGHFVRLGTKHNTGHWKEWEGIEIFDGTNLQLVNKMLDEENFDMIITFWDIWLMAQDASQPRFPKDKWIAWVPIDTEKIGGQLLRVVKDTGYQIAMSQHGERELKENGFKPYYCPLGIDTDVFKVKPEGRISFRNNLGLTDDNFLIGCVGLNYGDDRKGIIRLLQAFKEFHVTHPEARLYVHTHWEGKYPGTINYRQVTKNLGLDNLVAVPVQEWNDIGRIQDHMLADIYNGFDVFCLPTKGEGFGLPLVEAQACGVPVITTDTTTGRELCLPENLIAVYDDDYNYLGNDSWRPTVRFTEIVERLNDAWLKWKDPKASFHPFDEKFEINQGLEIAKEYDFNKVWKENWQPTFNAIVSEMEKAKKKKADKPSVSFVSMEGKQ